MLTSAAKATAAATRCQTVAGATETPTGRTRQHEEDNSQGVHPRPGSAGAMQPQYVETCGIPPTQIRVSSAKVCACSSAGWGVHHRGMTVRFAATA